MTHHFATRQLRFFLTASSPCPYLPGREERKVFAHLPLAEGASVNDALTQIGFRRSQNIAYRPACEMCDACVSARIPTVRYPFSKSERRVLERNTDLSRHLVEAEATMEQFELLRRYLLARHAEGGMADMTWPDYVAMVEDTAVRTHMVEYRAPAKDGGRLVCHSETATGSLMAKKTCYRADDMAERKQQERSNLEHMQNNQPLQVVGK